MQRDATDAEVIGQALDAGPGEDSCSSCAAGPAAARLRKIDGADDPAWPAVFRIAIRSEAQRLVELVVIMTCERPPAMSRYASSAEGFPVSASRAPNGRRETHFGSVATPPPMETRCRIPPEAARLGAWRCRTQETQIALRLILLPARDHCGRAASTATGLSIAEKHGSSE